MDHLLYFLPPLFLPLVNPWFVPRSVRLSIELLLYGGIQLLTLLGTGLLALKWVLLGGVRGANIRLANTVMRELVTPPQNKRGFFEIFLKNKRTLLCL